MQIGERFEISTSVAIYQCLVEGLIPQDNLPQLYPMQFFSQRDPSWSHVSIGSSPYYNIGNAGCAVTCAASILTTIDPNLTPHLLVDLLNGHMGFTADSNLIWETLIGNLVPAKGTAIGTEVEFLGPSDRSSDGELIWRKIPADMVRVFQELRLAPVIMQVDFVPGGVLDSHFVVALEFDEAISDVYIYDPWDGVVTHLLQRYALDSSWTLARAIYGLRLLRVTYQGGVLQLPYSR